MKELKNNSLSQTISLFNSETNSGEEWKELSQKLNDILNITNQDLIHENANMNANSPAGQMMNSASYLNKEYALNYLISDQYASAHRNGYIHIHDLDYYGTKTTTCLQYNLHELFKNGFYTEKGYIREPQSISTYAALATIVFQTNQNEQHGGQAIPAFDYFLAPGVLKSFIKNLQRNLVFYCELNEVNLLPEKIKEVVNLQTIVSIEQKLNNISKIFKNYNLSKSQLNKIWEQTYKQTEKETFQALESFIFNLNTMHSRGGNQVVFSSINYGTDTSPEGRMVIKQLLLATQKGLGHGETPIFPIQIFKVKNGISYSNADIELAIANWENDNWQHQKYQTPNFDLLIQACITNTTRLFPNFLFLDTPFNKHELWDHNQPFNYLYEVATMGCRTRVFENVNGPKTSVSRGNLSFTSINLPRLALETIAELGINSSHLTNDQIELVKNHFFNKVRIMAKLVADQLYERYLFQISAQSQQFSFMLNNKLWKNNDTNSKNLEGYFKNGTLGIGFIGGYNAMYALFHQSHAQSETAYQTLYQTVQILNEIANEYKNKYHLNFSVIATPAEGLSGRFTKLDQERFGKITNVTDRSYYVNSFHIDVKEPISIFAKIQKESLFHAITLGGHITYVELDSNLKYNIPAILKIIKVMHDCNIGYGSINHPVDTCLECQHTGVIANKCPNCNSNHIRRIRRITGYLTGSLNSWNAAKQQEEQDRVKHGYYRD